MDVYAALLPGTELAPYVAASRSALVAAAAALRMKLPKMTKFPSLPSIIGECFLISCMRAERQLPREISCETVGEWSVL